jgi:replicative DNA helicase
MSPAMPPDNNMGGRSEARLMPHSVEMEQLVLGAMILNKPAISRAISVLGGGDAFYRARHGDIYRAIARLYERDVIVDVAILAEELERNSVLEECGGLAYLADIAGNAGTSANVEYHSKLITDHWLRRKLIGLSNSLQVECYESPDDVESILGKFEDQMFKLSDDRPDEGFAPLEKILHRAYAHIERVSKHDGEVIGIPSGYTQLDRLTAGFQRSELIIVAARPGMGKTSFILNIARNAAVNFRHPVGIFSLEMSAESVAQRLLCMEGKVGSQSVRTGNLESSDWKRLGSAVSTLANAPIFIDDSPNLTPLEIRAKGRRLVHEHNAQLIMVDYLQLMRMAGKHDNRAQEVAEISRSLKALSKDLDIPIIACSQVTREVEKRGDTRPKLSDLRESGSIEQDADVVMFVHRPEYYKQDEDDSGRSLQGIAEIIVEKQRNGPTGSLYLHWGSAFAIFDENLPEEFEQPMSGDDDGGGGRGRSSGGGGGTYAEDDYIHEEYVNDGDHEESPF